MEVIDCTKPPHVLLRRRQVEQRVGLTRSPLYARIAAGDFPAPIRIGNGRAVGWLEEEVDAWLKKQVAARRQPGPRCEEDAALVAQAVEQFRYALLAAGFVPPAELVADGELHRFPESVTDPAPGVCWYAFSIGHAGRATFGNFRTGIAREWRQESRKGRPKAFVRGGAQKEVGSE